MLMRAIGRVVAFTAVILPLGCALPPPAPAPTAGPPPPPAPMDAEAVRALYAAAHREEGTVMHGAHQGAQWTKWAKPDGSMELLAGHGLFADTGRFAIRGNMICTSWGIIDHGREGCERLVQVGDNEYMTYGMDGVEGSKFKVLPP
jgi:hypothetical protein